MILFSFLLDFFWDFVLSVFGTVSSLETVLSLKLFFLSFGCSNVYYYDSDFKFTCDLRFSYLLTVSFEYIKECVYFIFVGLNLRYEVPVLYSSFIRLCKSFFFQYLRLVYFLVHFSNILFV